MSISIPTITQRERTKAIGAGAVLGMAGMTAYYLPITKDRFVRNSYDIVTSKTKSDIEMLDEAALALSNKNLKNEHKLFLSQLGVDETIEAINTKVAELKKSLTDSDTVKNLKEGFLENFQNFKKSEALADPITTKALQKIRWTNFAWGTVIGFILGSVISLRMEDSQISTHQL